MPSSRAWIWNRISRLRVSTIDDRQLGHAGIGVAKRKLLRVFTLRAVADHLDDQVRGAFHLHISAAQRVPEVSITGCGSGV